MASMASMEFQFQPLMMLVLLLTFLRPLVESQSVSIPDMNPARALDAILQDYAYRALSVTPKTGVSFDGIVPENLTGLQISGVRLRSGSLFTRGVPMYKEFKIPLGIIEQPYVERLVLVYQNLGNQSARYYPLPGYVYLAPVLGLLAYNASDLSAKNLPELEIEASYRPILIDFESVEPAPNGSDPRCVSVDLHGQVNFTNVVSGPSGNRCLAFKHGHFSIVAKSKPKPNPKPKSTPPAPVSVSPPLVPPATSDALKPEKHSGIDSRVWVFVSSVVGGCLLLMLLALLVLWIRGYKRRKTTRKMERAAEGGEPLRMTVIGGVKAPAAMVTRTQPTIETEYVP